MKIRNLPILILVPALLLHLVIILQWNGIDLHGDESRYLQYAENLSNGFFVKGENPIIHSGPGYPLLIAPFIGLGIPLIFVRLLNVLLLGGAMVYLKKTFEFYVSPRQATIFVYLFAFYPTLIKWMPRIYSDILALFCLCGFIYHLISYFKQDKVGHIQLIYSGLLLGGLALTKYIFIYVILASLGLYSVLFLFTQHNSYKMALSVFVFGFVMYLPFIINNYMVTERVMLSGTNGAEIFYWRSTPFENEFGDWIPFDEVIGKRETMDEGDLSVIRENHLQFVNEVYYLPLNERNKRLKQKAVENIRQNPKNYIRNTVGSFLRLFFNYPRSYQDQKLTTFFHMVPGSILFYLTIFALALTLGKRIKIPFGLAILFLMGIIYVSGLTLLNGTARNLLCILPLLFLFNLYIYHRHIKINIT